MKTILILMAVALAACSTATQPNETRYNPTDSSNGRIYRLYYTYGGTGPDLLQEPCKRIEIELDGRKFYAADGIRYLQAGDYDVTINGYAMVSAGKHTVGRWRTKNGSQTGEKIWMVDSFYVDRYKPLYSIGYHCPYVY